MPVRPFKPGPDPRRNIKGRPKLPDLKAVMANALGQETKDGQTALDQIIEAMRRKAAQGDVRAAELLLSRGFGRVPERVDVTTQGEKIAVPPIVWLPPEPEDAA